MLEAPLAPAIRPSASFHFKMQAALEQADLGQRIFNFFVHCENIPDGRIQSFASANIDVRQLERNGIID